MANTFKRFKSQSIGSTPTAVGGYTVPAATQTTAIGLVIANTTSSPVTVDVSHKTSTTDTYMVKGATVPVGGSLVVIGGEQKVVMETDDSIEITSSAATSVDAVLSVLEIS